MGYTRQQWAQAFLAAIGAPVTTLNTNWVIAWTQFETSCCGGASYNLLNTTEPNTPGVVSNFNSVGVKNYDSFANGVGANAKVLQNGLYPDILTALRSSDSGALCNPGSSISQQLGTWGTGSAQAIAAAACSGNVQADQSFSGTATNVNPAANIGSQQPCRPGPGGCPTNEECVQLNKDGSVIPCVGIGCVCVSNDYATSHTPAGILNPTNLTTILNLPKWFTNPDWIRVLKVVGGVLMLAGALLIAFWPEAEQAAGTAAKAAVL